jgi:hypothetical protein
MPHHADDEETGLMRNISNTEDDDEPSRHIDQRRASQILMGSHMRSLRLIGQSNPRYKWEKYWKSDEQLRTMKKPMRKYYERTNYLVQQYLYIDRLLDSSLPHDLVNEYNNLPPSSFRGVEVPDTISEEPTSSLATSEQGSTHGTRTGTASASSQSPTVGDYGALNGDSSQEVDGQGLARSGSFTKKVKRTPRDIYRPTETTPLFRHDEEEPEDGGPKPEVPWLEDDDDIDSSNPIVTLAIYVNLAANVLLLAGKIAVVASVPSMSVLASLVDAVLDFLSTVIVWITTFLISRQDQYQYPVGRRRLEPLGVLVFSVIMITSFAQVALESLQRLASPDHAVIEL